MVLLLILQTIYLMLPGIFANMAPVIFKDVRFADRPIDHGKSLGGKRIFGDNKTYRGFIVGIGSAIIVAYIQLMLYQVDVFKGLSLIPYPELNPLQIGFLMGFGVLFGDLVESFLKRRAGKGPGERWFPWDQMDSVIGGLLFLAIAWMPSLEIVLIAVALSVVLHVSVRYLAFWLGINKSKW